MGKVGFVFEINFEDNFGFDEKFLDEIFLKKKYVVIFVEKKNVSGNYIIYSKKFSLNEGSFFYLSKELNLSDFHVLEDSNFLIGRICTNDRTIVDFENLTFWFSPKDFKSLKFLLNINDLTRPLKEEIVLRVLEIYDLF
ncbi:MAG: hypothetical protein KC589_00530 [Nanoarchaeota archaeon]|nr:hypothetical protein [Nanoarchaeota archaeon]